MVPLTDRWIFKMYLFIRERRSEGERESNIGCLSHVPQLGRRY